MAYQLRTDLTKQEYDRLAKTMPYYNLYQTAAWCEVKKEWRHLYTALYQEEKPLICALVLFRPLALGMTLAYIPRGPLGEWENKEALTEFFRQMKAVCRKQKAILLRVDPNVLLSSVPWKQITEHTPVRSHPLIDTLKEIGFVHHGFDLDLYATSQPRFSAVLS